VNAPFLKTGAFDAQNLVTISVRHAIRQLGTLTPEQMRVVEQSICRWLGLPVQGDAG
jgi:mRNA interferase MazF